MNVENHKIIFPRGNEESRRMTDLVIEELSMFSITDSGKFEGVGAHDDLVMGLALANAATQANVETFVLLDDLELFKQEAPKSPMQQLTGVMGLNF